MMTDNSQLKLFPSELLAAQSILGHTAYKVMEIKNPFQKVSLISIWRHRESKKEVTIRRHRSYSYPEEADTFSINGATF